LVHIQLELSDLIPENVGEGRTLKSKKMSPPHNLVAGTHNSTTANVTRELIQYYFKAHILSLYITKPHKNKMNSEETNESNQKDLSSFHFSLKIDSCPSLLDLSLPFFLSLPLQNQFHPNTFVTHPPPQVNGPSTIHC